MILWGPYESLCKGVLPSNAVTKDEKNGDVRVLYIPTAKGDLFHQAEEPYVLGEGGRGSAKALALDTPIPTPTGFVPLGDVRVGDRVLDEQGQSCVVTAKSPVFVDPTGTFQITFSDGHTLVCGGDHLWCSHTKQYRKAISRGSVAVGTGVVMTTREMAATLTVGKEKNHAIPLAQPWNLPEVVLPLDPYVLGVWLGDGSRNCGYITSADPEILWEVQKAGFPVRFLGRYTWAVEGLFSALNSLDAVDQTMITCVACGKPRKHCCRHLCRPCNDHHRHAGTIAQFPPFQRTGRKRWVDGVLRRKRIPESYFWGSVAQRLALLQGLMDTDGAITPEGSCTFTNTNKNLTLGVRRLAQSLGLRAWWQEDIAMLHGRPIGPSYKVGWSADLPVFRLPRKRRLIQRKRRFRYRYITRIDHVDPVLVQCLTVDSPSHLFLVGEAGIPTHNSTTLRWDAHLRNLMFPGHRALLLRRTFPQLRGSHFARVAVEGKLFGEDICPKEFNVSKYFLEYKNGSLLQFGHCESDSAVMDYLSQEWDWIGFDELTTFNFDQFIRISMSARTTRGSTNMAFVRAATNPIGEGASWVKRYFIDHSVTEDENPDYRPEDWRDIKMNLQDNPHMDRQEYEKKLLMLPNESLRKAYIEGEWLVEGQFFSEFSERRAGQPWHVLPEIPRWRDMPIWYARDDSGRNVFEVIRTIDWGYSEAEPGWCGWFVMLTDGTALLFQEWVFKQRIPEDVAKIIVEKSEGMKIRMTLGDPMMDQERTGLSIRETMARNGVSAIMANNDRENGWAALHSWLVTTYNDGTGERPRLQLLAGQGPGNPFGVPYAIRTLPSLQTDPKNPKDILEGINVEDHAADAIRYWASNRPAPSRVLKPSLAHLAPEVRRAIYGHLEGEDVLGSESVRG